MAKQLSKFDNNYLETHPDYTDLNVSEKVVNILQSYIDYINFTSKINGNYALTAK